MATGKFTAASPAPYTPSPSTAAVAAAKANAAKAKSSGYATAPAPKFVAAPPSKYGFGLVAPAPSIANASPKAGGTYNAGVVAASVGAPGGAVGSSGQTVPTSKEGAAGATETKRFELVEGDRQALIRNKQTGRTVEIPINPSEKGQALRARLLALAEKTGDLSSATVGQNAAAIGLGMFSPTRSAVVETQSRKLAESSKAAESKQDTYSTFVKDFSNAPNPSLTMRGYPDIFLDRYTNQTNRVKPQTLYEVGIKNPVTGAPIYSPLPPGKASRNPSGQETEYIRQFGATREKGYLVSPVVEEFRKAAEEKTTLYTLPEEFGGVKLGGGLLVAPVEFAAVAGESAIKAATGTGKLAARLALEGQSANARKEAKQVSESLTTFAGTGAPLFVGGVGAGLVGGVVFDIPKSILARQPRTRTVKEIAGGALATGLTVGAFKGAGVIAENARVSLDIPIPKFQTVGVQGKPVYRGLILETKFDAKPLVGVTPRGVELGQPKSIADYYPSKNIDIGTPATNLESLFAIEASKPALKQSEFTRLKVGRELIKATIGEKSAFVSPELKVSAERLSSKGNEVLRQFVLEEAKKGTPFQIYGSTAGRAQGTAKTPADIDIQFFLNRDKVAPKSAELARRLQAVGEDVKVQGLGVVGRKKPSEQYGHIADIKSIDEIPPEDTTLAGSPSLRGAKYFGFGFERQRAVKVGGVSVMSLGEQTARKGVSSINIRSTEGIVNPLEHRVGKDIYGFVGKGEGASVLAESLKVQGQTEKSYRVSSLIEQFKATRPGEVEALEKQFGKTAPKGQLLAFSSGKQTTFTEQFRETGTPAFSSPSVASFSKESPSLSVPSSPSVSFETRASPSPTFNRASSSPASPRASSKLALSPRVGKSPASPNLSPSFTPRPSPPQPRSPPSPRVSRGFSPRLFPSLSVPYGFTRTPPSPHGGGFKFLTPPDKRRGTETNFSLFKEKKERKPAKFKVPNLGIIPDLFNIGITEKATGRLSYGLPKERAVYRSKIYRKSGGFLIPTVEQLKGRVKAPKGLSKF